MLPKVIHYCWFGGSEMPESYKSLIAEWETLHPSWSIKRWDESNAPMSLPYIKKAKENNNWANISNYVRLYALGREGGIYLDTDMKVLQPLDKLLLHNCFLGFESGSNEGGEFWVNNAIMGAQANHPFVMECEQYLLEQFDGTEQANLSSPQLVTALLKTRRGLKQYGRQSLDDIMLYEKEVFYPIPVDKAYLLKEVNAYPEETVAVHLWGRTWFTNEMLIDEMDNLRRYTHELNDLIQKTTKTLTQSQSDLNVANSRLQEVQLENTMLKTIIKDSLEKKINELISNQKDMTEQQGKMNQQQEDIIMQLRKMNQREGLWSIAKRKLFNYK
ncbi:hypothetical protein A4H97_06675 [Niastella yeongjuensis]|uniref:Alpha 1,4-glycosyltransferase domain-containing protein n=1 Tax=Niastella yeongjuensis TaxID=354355 RepID=A0A1V9EM23_9BACT|nr:glycosyltransferase [Niastella yeongjuensis]OQP47187.1 hypothetical protein A4H97_06675 [Niastella yeongjuensis]SEN73302.1 Alpha 1,4-glycosyltransferase conserved region [Niastella yeongjuensis]